MGTWFRCMLLAISLPWSSVMAQPAPPPSLHVYEAVIEGRAVSAVSLLSSEHVARHGLAHEAILGSLRVSPQHGGEITPANFVANPQFVDFLQEFLGRVAPTDPALARAARAQGDGWVYLLDRRTPTPMGDVPAEDIFGGFEVRGGELVAGSWHPMDSHRLVTERGVFRLDRFLAPRLLEALEQLPGPDTPSQ
jgi:hypothetical protein